jgi:TolB-like protein
MNAPRPSRFLPLLLASVLASAPLAAQDPVPDTRPGVAVFAFENGGSYGADRADLEPLTVGLQQMLLSELAQNSELRVVERQALRAILEEQDLGTSGRVDASTAVELGRLVQARYVVLGVFVDFFSDFRMDATLVDVETGEVVGAETVRDDRSNLYSLLVELAGKLTLRADLPPLPLELREARDAREIPAEAVILYSRAQTFADFGDEERAVALYRRIVTEFPEMTEAGEALRQLAGEG